MRLKVGVLIVCALVLFFAFNGERTHKKNIGADPFPKSATFNETKALVSSLKNDQQPACNAVSCRYVRREIAFENESLVFFGGNNLQVKYLESILFEDAQNRSVAHLAIKASFIDTDRRRFVSVIIVDFMSDGVIDYYSEGVDQFEINDAFPIFAGSCLEAVSLQGCFPDYQMTVEPKYPAIYGILINEVAHGLASKAK